MCARMTTKDFHIVIIGSAKITRPLKFVNSFKFLITSRRELWTNKVKSTAPAFPEKCLSNCFQLLLAFTVCEMAGALTSRCTLST